MRLRRIDLRHGRSDRVGLKRPIVRPDGSMIVDGFVAREGIMEYVQPDGRILREFVSASTLRDTAKSLVGLPVTMEHPTDQFGRDVQVTPDNFADFAVGSVVSAEFDENTGAIVAGLSIIRRDILTAVADGKVELSPGYDAEVSNSPGSNSHGAFDAQQTWRGYNHVAFVDEARGGSTVRARVDSSGNVINDPPGEPTHPRGQHTMNPNLLALAALVGLTDAFATDNDAIGAIRRKVDGMKSDNATKDGEITTLRADAAKQPDAVDPAEFERVKTENTELRTKVDAMNTKAEMDALAPMVAAYEVKVDKADKADDVVRAIAGKITGEKYDDKSDISELRGLVRGHYAAKHGGKDSKRTDGGNRPTDGDTGKDPFGRDIVRTDAAREDGKPAGERAWSDAFSGGTREDGKQGGQTDPPATRNDSVFRPGPSAIADSNADRAFTGKPAGQ